MEYGAVLQRCGGGAGWGWPCRDVGFTLTGCPLFVKSLALCNIVVYLSF